MQLIQDVYYTVCSRIKVFTHQVRNVFRWTPVIWNDRDWDSGYVYAILYFKLKNMEEFFRSGDTYTVNAEKRAQEIRIAKDLARRLAEEDQLENATMWHDKRFEPVDFEDLIEDVPGQPFSIYVGDPNKERGESFGKCCKHAEYLRKRDKEYFFDYMKKKIDGWWD